MKTNKEVVYNFFEATNSRDWERVSLLIHSDFVRHSSSIPHEINTSTELISFHKQEVETFPDLVESIVFMIEENDLVAVRVHFSGTQLGYLGQFPPSGKRLTAEFNCFFRVVDGKLKESWVEYDNLNGLVQLGHYTFTI